MKLAPVENPEPVWAEEYRSFVDSALGFPHRNAYQTADEIFLHLIPYRCVMPGREHLGSTKDITGRWEFLRDRGLSALIFPCVLDESKPRAWDRIRYMYSRFFSDFPLGKKRLTVMIDSPGSFPRQARVIKQQYPQSVILFRAHNAEFPHRLDRFRVLIERAARKGLIKVIARQIFSDLGMVARSDWVLPISEYDGTAYWRRLATLLGKRHRVQTLPYFLPESYYRLPHRLADKKNTVVCISSGKTKADRIDEGTVCFLGAVEKMRHRYPKLPWKFVVTGGKRGQEIVPGIEQTGFLESPMEVLAGSRVACVLTSFGWGFKTKILEAVESGNMVITTQVVYDRLPVWIQRYCLPIEPKDPHDFARALKRATELSGEVEANDLNRWVRTQAFDRMDRFLVPTR